MTMTIEHILVPTDFSEWPTVRWRWRSPSRARSTLG